MGAMFSHLAQLARDAGGGIGPCWRATRSARRWLRLFVVALMPIAGNQMDFCSLTALGYFLRQPARASASARDNFHRCAFLLTVAMGFNARLRIVDVPPGGQNTFLSRRRDGFRRRHRRHERPTHIARGQSFQMGGTAAADAEYRQAHLPLLLHPAPRRALFLGVGTGISFGAASLYPQLQADGVELVPEVVEAMNVLRAEEFFAAQQSNLNSTSPMRGVSCARPMSDTTSSSVTCFIPIATARARSTRANTSRPFANGSRPMDFSANGCRCTNWTSRPCASSSARFTKSFRYAEAWLLRFNVDVPVMALIGSRMPQAGSTNIVESRLAEAATRRRIETARAGGLASALRSLARRSRKTCARLPDARR